MSKSMLRTVIVILTAVTAIIHLALNFTMGTFDPVFTANAAGYAVLGGAFLGAFKFLKGRERLVQIVFMLYTLVTILAWVAIGEKNIATLQGMLGYADKAVEVLLLITLFRHGPNEI